MVENHWFGGQKLDWGTEGLGNLSSVINLLQVFGQVI